MGSSLAVTLMKIQQRSEPPCIEPRYRLKALEALAAALLQLQGYSPPNGEAHAVPSTGFREAGMISFAISGDVQRHPVGV